MPVVTTLDGTSPGEQLTPADSLSLTPDTVVHFIGIGGSGMSSLAHLLIERSITVTGSDIRNNTACDVLSQMGATITIGHDKANVGKPDFVVISNAVIKSNEERAYAHDNNIPVVLRADLLNMLMRGTKRILISGTHGKTSTTSLTTMGLQGGKQDPSFAIGGAIHSGGASAHHGETPIFVAEADEAFRSFLRLEGDCIVITNLEMDHHDVYANIDAIYESFAIFINKSTGPIIACGDDLGVQTFLQQQTFSADRPVITYGFNNTNTVQIVNERTDENNQSRFNIMSTDDAVLVPKEEFSLFIPGRHNILNATAAAIAACWAMGSTGGVVAKLAQYQGAVRRFQRLGTIDGVTVVDDYAHHPTEIAATIQAARQACGEDGRVVIIFQPHRYTRTKELGVELGAAMRGADIAVITNIYAAGEQAEPGITGAIVADAASQAGVDVRYMPNPAQLFDIVIDIVKPNDVVVTMGAGDITQFGPRLLDGMDGRS